MGNKTESDVETTPPFPLDGKQQTAPAERLDRLASLVADARSVPLEENKIVLPVCRNAADFVGVSRPALAFHIQDLLPVGGKMTFSAMSKWGKSLWAIETGLALAAGGCEWLGWTFGPSVRVLYLQAEIMDSLLAARLRRIIETAPPQIDVGRGARELLIQEIAASRPNLFNSSGRKVAEGLIGHHKPGVLILDPLAALCPGLEENEAAAMGAVLDYFMGLTLRFGCAVIVIHHHGKSGVSRGSSVFEAWPESDLQATFHDEDRTIAKVERRLRCVFNSGPIYWRMPSQDDLWFSLMPSDWTPENARGRKIKAQPKHAITALKAAHGPLIWKELVAAVCEMTDCGQRTAEKAIKEAKDGGSIWIEAGTYVLPR